MFLYLCEILGTSVCIVALCSKGTAANCDGREGCFGDGVSEENEGGGRGGEGEVTEHSMSVTTHTDSEY